MGKRNKGKGKGKRRRGGMTKRDTNANKAQRAARVAESDATGAKVASGGEAGDDADSAVDDADGAVDDADGAVDDADGAAEGAAWALPLVKLDEKWTWIETRMMFVALIMLTCVLCLWFGIRGMKEPLEAEVPAGTIWRAMVGAAVLGAVARVVTRGRAEERTRNIITIVAVIAGLALAKTWRGIGIEYFETLNDWLQEGSALTLFGGLKGISTRLTMLVALMGGSLAAAAGMHINIDVLVRLLPKVTRKPVAIAGALATAIVCLAASWGFMDHVAITSFGAKIDGAPSAKVGHVADKLGDHFWVWRKQVGFDLGAIPYVVRGVRWNDESRFKAKDWNEWLESSGMAERFGAEQVATLRAPEDEPDVAWTPFVIVPGEDTRGMLVHAMDLLWPLGFFFLGLRFILRALLLFAGHIRMHVEGEGSGDADETAQAAEGAV